MQSIAPAELGGWKANSYRHAELGVNKVKKKQTNNECSGLLTVLFVFFVLRKGKQKNSFVSFFLFTATNSSFFPFHWVPKDSAVPHLGINPEKMKNLKDTGTPKISAQQRTIVRSGKQAKCRNCR